MTKVDENLFPKIILQEAANDGSDFSNPPADYRVAWIGEDGLWHVKDSAGTVTSPYSGGGSAVPLGLTSYLSGSDASIATFTSSTMADVDATNAKVTCVVPASGKVVIRASVLVGAPAGNGFLGLRVGSTNIARTYAIGGGLAAMRLNVVFVLTGQTPGSTTYKLAAGVTTSGTMTVYGGASTGYGALVMEAWEGV